MIRDWQFFLVTGPEPSLERFATQAMFVIEVFDRRDQTLRCRAFGEDGGAGAKARAVKIAMKHNCTVQDLVDTGRRENARTLALGAAKVTVAKCVEEYPVVWLGSHGMKWPDYRAAQRPPACESRRGRGGAV